MFFGASKIEQFVDEHFGGKPGVYRYHDSSSWSDLPSWIRHEVKVIQPFAFYFNGQKILVFFLKSFSDNRVQQEKHQAIWNTQTPIVVQEEGGQSLVFYGAKLDKDRRGLSRLPIKEEEFSYWSLIQEKFWRDKIALKKKDRVDQTMLKNLLLAIRVLKDNGLSGSTSEGESIALILMLRLLFIRILIDKGFFKGSQKLNGPNFQSSGHPPVVGFIVQNFQDSGYLDAKKFHQLIQEKDQLYNFFLELKDHFNGSIFEVSDEEHRAVQPSHLSILHDLFEGWPIDGQRSLFPIYNFDLISISLVSALYDRLIENERRNDDKAFYTPAFLARYAISLALQNDIADGKQCIVLDPSCGTGVFLVESYSKLLEWNDQQTLNRRRSAFEILEQDIFGIDINHDAINVAIFSLYVMAIEHGESNKNGIFRFPPLKGCNIKAGNYFDPQNLEWLRGIGTTHLLGNPPWGSIAKGKDTDFDHFVEVENQATPMLISDRQIAQSFVVHTRNFLSSGTQVAFILTSKLLYNIDAKTFRDFLLSNFRIHTVTDFSPVRRALDWGAIGPAVVIHAEYTPNFSDTKHLVRHQSVKPNVFFERYETVVIEKLDTKKILQKQLKKDWLWKPMLYGTVLDMQFIERMILTSQEQDLEDSEGSSVPLKDYLTKNKIVHGAGFKIGASKVSTESIAHLRCLDSEDFGLLEFAAKAMSKTFRDHFPNRDRIDGIGKIDAYFGPHLLLKRGISTHPVVAYTIESCCFSNSIFGFHGLGETHLKFFGAMLLSRFARYFLFQQDPQWGVERDEVYLATNLTLPCPVVTLNDEVSVAELFDLVSQKGTPEFLDFKGINAFLSDHFSFSEEEEALMNYAEEVSIPLLSLKGRNLVNAPIEDRSILEAYASVMLAYFGESLKFRKKYISCQIFHQKGGKSPFSGIEFQISELEPAESIKHTNDVPHLYKLITESFFDQQSLGLFVQNDFKGYTDDGFWIVKSNQCRSWHAAIAYLDISDILRQLMKNVKTQAK